MSMIAPVARESKAPAKVVPTARPANPKLEREAAARLGTIYLELARLRATPLGLWAIAPEKGRGDVHGPFYAVLGMVYGTDPERERKYGRANYQSRFALYKKDFDAVVPGLLESVFSFATLALNAEVIALTTLFKRLTNEPGLSDWLHTASEEIIRQKNSKEFRAELRRDLRTEEAVRAGSPPPRESDTTESQTGYEISYLSPSEVKRLIRARLAKSVRYSGDEVLNILFEHPEGMSLLTAYAESAQKGTVASIVRLLQAIDAVEKFARKALQEKHALRYPFFILAGVAQRKLHDIPGFSEFAVSLGPILVRDTTETVLTFAAMAVGCLSMVFAGPAAPLLVNAVFASADLAFAGMGLGLTFMREREQDLGSQGSAFRGQANQFATPVVYLDTALAGAATLLSAIAFFSAAKDLRAVLNARARPRAGAISTERSAASAESKRLTTAPENKAIAGRAKDGVRGADDPLTGNNLAKRQQPEERYVTATSKEDQARAIARDAEAQRGAKSEKPSSKSAQQKPRRSPDKPEPNPEQQRMTNRTLEPQRTSPANERVTTRKLVERERENLRKQIDQKQKEIDELNAAKNPVLKRNNRLIAEREAARRRGDAAEYARLQSEVEQGAIDYEGHLYKVKKAGSEKLELIKRLNDTTSNYFEALTSAASKEAAYTEVAAGKLDDVFKAVEGPRSVEHVRPRSLIFETPGFLDKIIWEQQKFLFNLPKNLKLAPSRFNLRRGVVPYAKLNRGFWSTYIKQDEIEKLITLEAQVERDIDNLIASPQNASLWRSFGYTGPFK